MYDFFQFLVLLIIGAFLFTVFGVIALLGRTKRLGEELKELKTNLNNLSYRISSGEKPAGARPAAVSAELRPPAEQPAVPSAVDDGFHSISRLYNVPDNAAKPDLTSISWRSGTPGPAQTRESLPQGPENPPQGPENPPQGPESLPQGPESLPQGPESLPQGPESLPQGPETRVSGEFGGKLAAFIHGGNVWAAGGVVLLIAAFAMLMTYMARRGFFTLEMRIAAAALS
ncbi:MAG: hypothetical protein LBK74_10785, partial [Treponema sp.]|nr:hypothetical protein [Treponema sp.]